MGSFLEHGVCLKQKCRLASFFLPWKIYKSPTRIFWMLISALRYYLFINRQLIGLSVFQGIVNKTPVFTSSAFNQLCGKLVYFKCEQFQKVGAFKFRGASNSVLLLSDEEAQKGVVTHSSGNHAQALALAAKERGIKAYIIMPKNSPKVKRDAVENTYKGQVIICESNTKAREDTCKQIQELTGSTFIAPYDNVNVIAGQGTAAIELLEEVEDLDAVVAPVGGGGLLSGTSIACKGFNPKIRVFGAEPKMANDAELSLKEGTIVPQLNPRTIADGLRTSLGVITFPIIKV